MNKVQVTLKKSLIGSPETLRRTVEALGLRRINSTRVFTDSPGLRGMIQKVIHLVDVKPVAG